MPENDGAPDAGRPAEWTGGVVADAERQAAVQGLLEALRLFSVESDVFVDVFARAHHLGRNDLNAIMWIADGTTQGQPVTAGDLSARLGLGPPAVTALIDRLEQAGHIQRSRDLHDRRKVAVRMQDQALELAQAFFRPLGKRMAAAVDDVSSADLERCTEIVERLAAAVIDARQAAGAEANSSVRSSTP